MARFAQSSLACALAVAVLRRDACAFRTKSHKKKASRAGARTVAGVPLYEAPDMAILDGWMVAFGPEATDATLEAFCAKSGPCTHIGHPDNGGIPFVAVKGSEEAVGLSVEAHERDITFVEQDAVAQDYGRMDETLRRKGEPAVPWNLREIGAPAARSGGQGVNVYVLDSGVRVTHQAFGGRAIPLYDATRTPHEVCNPTDTDCAKDERGHGSHVAGIVGADFWGVASASTIYAMQRGNTFSDGYASMDWLAQNRKTPAVLTLSWGGLFNSEVAKAAVDAAVAASITLVAGAGNNGVDACEFTFAYIPKVISVAAMDPFFKRPAWSNYGDCVDLFAPGDLITSLSHEDDAGTDKRSGTSMAGPHVAGAVALILEASPQLSPAAVEAELLASWTQENRIRDVRGPTNLMLQVGEIAAATETNSRSPLEKALNSAA